MKIRSRNPNFHGRIVSCCRVPIIVGRRQHGVAQHEVDAQRHPCTGPRPSVHRLPCPGRLWRSIAYRMEGRNVFIYVSSPVRRLRGGFKVDKVWAGSPETVWNQVSALAQVDRETFDSYYAGRSVDFALGISSVWEYKNQPSLTMLRKRFPQFVVPQSWRYLRDDEHRSFCRMNRLAGRKPTASISSPKMRRCLRIEPASA